MAEIESNQSVEGTPDGPQFAVTERISSETSSNRLVQLLDSYMKDLREGRVPDRDRLLAENPDLASQLKECLGGIDFVHRASERPGGLPDQLGDFRILREIGRGGMGVVYEAEQVSLRRRVALKVLRFGGVADLETVTRFQREAETVAALDHANIVPVYAVGSESGVHFFAMQLIEGHSLSEVIERRASESGDELFVTIARWCLEAAEALDFAHRHGVIHRDVKPSNLLLDRHGHVWLTDFGLARRSVDVTLSVAGGLLGTPRYMSPEQASSIRESIDHRTDIYSLGVTLYELSTGKPFLEADTPQGVITKILTSQPTTPRRLVPNLPRDLETIILKAIAREPSDRYATAADMAFDLRSFLEHLPIRARRPTLAERAVLALRRHRPIVNAAVLSAICVLMLIVSGLLIHSNFRQSLLGEVGFSTKGPQLIGSIFDVDGQVVVPEFAIPTAEPLSLPSGDYQLMLAADGVVSESWPLQIRRGQSQTLDVGVLSRWLWPPVEMSADDLVLRDVVSLATEKGASEGTFPEAGVLLTVFELEAERQTSRVRLRCLDGRSGQSLWPGDLVLNPESAPPGQSAQEWSALLLNPGIRSNHLQRLHSEQSDFDGDGISDLLFVSRCLPSLLAVSGANGTVLWWFRARPELPPELMADDGRWGEMRPGTVLGEPVLADVDQDRVPDIIVCLLSSAESFQLLDGTTIRSEAYCRWEAISGATGRSLWKQPIDVDLQAALYGSDEADRAHAGCRLQLANADARRIVTGVVAGKLIRLDVRSGAKIGEDSDLGFEPFRILGCLDPDHDQQDGLLIIRQDDVNRQQTLVLIPLRSGNADKAIWESSPMPIGRNQHAGLMREHRRQLLEDLDGDERPELIAATGSEVSVPNGQRASTHRWCGVERIDTRTGTAVWRRQLTTTDIYLPPSVDHLTAGPDLDGDGWREVFVCWMAPETEDGWKHSGSLCVAALSGRDGRTFWRKHHLLHGVQQHAMIGGVPKWWQPGTDGWPVLSVSLEFLIGGPRRTLFFTASNGQLVHTLNHESDPDVADLDRDGIPDLLYQVSPQGTPRLMAVRGAVPVPWKRLGDWSAIPDVDGDGADDLLLKSGVAVSSGSSGALLWQLAADETSFRDDGLHVAPGLPYGDLDADGAPDLIGFVDILHYNVATSGSGSDRTLLARSGNDGRVIWRAADFGMSSGSMSGGRWGCSYRYPSLDWTDLNGDRMADLMVVHHQLMSTAESNANRSRLTLSVVDGRDGRLRWQIPVIPGGFGFRPDPYGNRFSDLNGDGTGDPVLWTPDGDDSGPCRLVAVNGDDGEVLWSASSETVSDVSRLLWPRPAVGDLDGDGQSEIVIVRRAEVENESVDASNELVVLSGRDGSRQWSYQWTGSTAVLPPLLPSAGHKDNANERLVCPGVFVQDQWTVLSFRADGRLMQEIPLGTSRNADLLRNLWQTADVDGDGREELLCWREESLTALHGVDGEVVWSWPLPADDCMLLRDEMHHGRPEIAVWAGSDAYGLAQKTGQAVWECPLASRPVPGQSHPFRVQLLNGSPLEQLPRVLLNEPSYIDRWVTVVQRAEAAAGAGLHPRLIPLPRTYPVADDEWGWKRRLPWVADGRADANWYLSNTAVPLGLAGLVVLLLPLWLCREALRRRSLLLLLAAAVYGVICLLGPFSQALSLLLLLPVSVRFTIPALRERDTNLVKLAIAALLLPIVVVSCLSFVGAVDGLTRPGMSRSTAFWWWLDELVAEPALIGLFSLPGVVFWWRLCEVLRDHRWNVAGQLLSASALLALFLGGLWLAVDWMQGAFGDYLVDGWYVIWMWSSWLIGLTLLLMDAYGRLTALFAGRRT